MLHFTPAQDLALIMPNHEISNRISLPDDVSYSSVALVLLAIVHVY